MSGNDFVNVRLSPHGERLAGSGAVRVHEGHREFVLRSGETIRVTAAFEWRRILSAQTVDGYCLFEIAPENNAEESTGKQDKTDKQDKEDAKKVIAATNAGEKRK